MVILVFFNVLKIANVQPLVGQKGPHIPTVVPKKMAVLIKMQSTGEKQQFTQPNKMLDYLISRLENLKILMEFEAKYFEKDRYSQRTVLQKQLCKKYFFKRFWDRGVSQNCK